MTIPEIRALRGMKDIPPTEAVRWQYMERCVTEVFSRYGYGQIRTPIVESTGLFQRSIGEVTDIVEKEMYSFVDRSGDGVTLRPEGTAGVVRAVKELGLVANGQTQKLWYQGPMFRYERPQKGRYRQFHQIGVEALGFPDADVEAEQFLMMTRLWRVLGLDSVLRLQLNNLGSATARAAYREALVAYLKQHRNQLDEDSLRRLESNPLRILDAKSQSVQAILVQAPRLDDYVEHASKSHFAQLCAYLTSAGIAYEHNHFLVRGLDYYNGTVFEWITDRLGAQNAICAGGRYDGLVEQLGGPATPAFGFAIGVERFLLLMESLGCFPMNLTQAPDVYVLTHGDLAAQQAMLLVEQIRDTVTSISIQVHLGGGSFKSRMKKADRSGARWLLILGEDELREQKITLKYLRDDSPQESLLWTELRHRLQQLICDHFGESRV